MKLLSLIVVSLVASVHAGRITDSLQTIFIRGGRQDVVVEFPSVMNQAITAIGNLGANPSEAARNQFINTLRAQTRAVQLPVMNAIQSLGLSSKATPFWIANRITLRGVEIGPLRVLAAVPGMFVIREAVRAKIYDPISEVSGEESLNRDGRQASDVAWGVAKINAPKVWAEGNSGQGIVVGVIDTGANVQHKALSPSYKNDALSWYDAFGDHKTPYDGNGHGTHCAGTIAGAANGIGVAPGAKFIACRGLDDEGSGNDTTLMTCGQFMACPSNPMNTTDAPCTGAPNVVSNSWGGLIGGMDFYNPIINVWRTLGIIPVFALGNSGPFCHTSGSPGDQPNLISVGATDVNDKLAMFSSRGPALTSRLTKPEVSAPGKDIVSASNTDNEGYKKLSGTSMACPHVAGTVALILSGNPKLDYEGVKKALETTAEKSKLSFMDAATVCHMSFLNPTPGYPNNGFGFGRINAEAAVKAGKEIR